MIVKFLIIRFSSIGDIVLTTPVIRGLKEQVENSEIHFLIKRKFVSVISENPYIDKIHVYDNNLSKLVKDLKSEKFTYIIDLHRNIRSFIVKNRLRIMSFSVNKLNFKRWLIVNLKINKLPSVHIVDRYLKTVTLFDVKNDKKGLDYFIPEDEQMNISELPEGFQNGYIAFAIGGMHNTKRLTTEKITYICKNVKLPVILLGGKDDEVEGDIIKNSVKDHCYNACGKYSINQSASLVQNASLVITHDTGLMHIAAAFKKIIISIWGNTIPEFGMYPYYPDERSVIIQEEKLKCRPCSKIGRQKCPKGHFDCIEKIDTDRIINNVKDLFTF